MSFVVVFVVLLCCYFVRLKPESGVLLERDRVLLLQQPQLAAALAPHGVPVDGLERELGLSLRQASGGGDGQQVKRSQTN